MLIGLLVPVLAILVLLALVGVVIARLYRRTTREISIVKTGAGGKRVIMDGGIIAIRAEAKKKDMLAQAEGQRAIVAAENALDQPLIDMKIELARLEAYPKLAAELVKPAEKIDSIRIHQVTGLGGGGAAGGNGDDKPVVNQALIPSWGWRCSFPR